MRRVVVMGVAGSGKTTLARVLAERLGATFLEADEYHQPASVAKMAAGLPLDDSDRQPWLEVLRDELGAHDRVVLACSALKERYRDVLRQAGRVHFLHLATPVEVLGRRLVERTDHFAGPALLASQLDDLELPRPHERDVTVLAADQPLDALVAAAEVALADSA